MIGNALATAVGGTHNNYILGALFFIIPFLLTQFMLNRSVSAVFVPICLLTCPGCQPHRPGPAGQRWLPDRIPDPYGHAGRPHVHG